MTLTIELKPGIPMVDQIDRRIRALVEAGALPPGRRLPSIRALAEQLGVSLFTVVSAYDRLTAANYIRSRHGAGFYVVEKQLEPASEPAPDPEAPIDTFWFLRAVKSRAAEVKLGAGSLPADWFDAEAIKRAARYAIRTAGASLTDYSAPAGCQPLRDLLALRLIDLGISVQADQIVMTHGATHGLDLALRTLVKPGGRVLIEDPGYYMMRAHLETLGIPALTAPRRHDGPDLAAVEAELAQGGVRLMIINSVLQNPTGSTISPLVAHRLLALAEKYDTVILEDDICGDFHPGAPIRLSNLDQLNRVVYLSSFSKTVAPNLRCGYLAASPALAARLLECKTITGLTTSELNERIVTELIASGHYRRQLERFRQQLAVKRGRAMQLLRAAGLAVPHEPGGGFFVWASLPAGVDGRRLARAALANGLVLAPGALFSDDTAHDGWMRVNVAHCERDFERRLATSLAAVS